MRRYGLKYHVVAGFSFYENNRDQGHDLLSKVILNPDDSVSLLGDQHAGGRDGKTTIETIERLALETGLSLWGAIGEAITRELLPARALSAMKSFRELIEDGSAMLAGKYEERLVESGGAEGGQMSRWLWIRLPLRQSTTVLRVLRTPTSIPATSALTSRRPIGEEQESSSIAFPESVGQTSSLSIEGQEDAAVVDEPVAGFRTPGEVATTAELLKFLIDRTGYIKQLEAEDTPEAYRA